MATKSKTNRSVKNVSQTSFLGPRPYLTIAVLAALVCALAFTVELIQNALRSEARAAYMLNYYQQETLNSQDSADN